MKDLVTFDQSKTRLRGSTVADLVNLDRSKTRLRGSIIVKFGQIWSTLSLIIGHTAGSPEAARGARPRPLAELLSI